MALSSFSSQGIVLIVCFEQSDIWHGQSPLLFLTGFQDTGMMPHATRVFLRLDMGEPEICPVEHALGNLSAGRFRGNGNFSDRKSLGRKQHRSRQNINVKQQTKFAAATSVANSVRS